MVLCGLINETSVGVLLALVAVVVTFFKWKFSYWKRRNVPYLEPSIPFGNFSKNLRGEEFSGFTVKAIYDEMKSRGWKHGGYYKLTQPIYLPVDLEIVKNVMVKDFKFFLDRDRYVNEKDHFQAHLLNLKGDAWRTMRSKLTPVFTSGKLKRMFEVMAESQTKLEEKLHEEVLKKEPIDIKDICSGYTTSIIASCAFGLEVDTLAKGDNDVNNFRRNLFYTNTIINLKRAFISLFPELAKLVNVSTQRQEGVDFITNLVQGTIDYRQKNNYSRNDLMQLLIKMMKHSDDGKPLNFDEVGSQALVFFVAGFETSSSLMTYAFYELARHQDIQDRLRREIVDAYDKNNHEFTYDVIHDMKYLNQVIEETLRLYPPATDTNRLCVEDYKVPGHDVIIQKGTPVTIPIMAIHYDEEYYPNPTKFDPERFTEENKASRPNYTHLPFGEGPRNCIGMRFGRLQAKMGLVAMLRKYRFSINPRTVEPLQFVPRHVILAAKDTIYLDAEDV